MIDKFYNSTSQGEYLKQGAAISYDELQRRIAEVQAYQQQSAVAAGLESQKKATLEAQQAARDASIYRQRQANYAAGAANTQIAQIQSVRNLANQVYKQTTGAYEDSLKNLQNSLNTIVYNTNAQINSNVGQVRAGFGASDIIVDSGSARDVANQVGVATLNEGRKQFAARVNDISNTINKITAMEVENKYSNLNADAQQQLIQINLNRGLNG